MTAEYLQAAIAAAPPAHCTTPDASTADVASGEIGYLHSVYSGSAVDGPGIRTVVWTTGCVLRCLYCHNPDSLHLKNGRRVTAEEVVADVMKYRSFMKATGGGVTITGGEPLVQAPFVTRILRACKDRGVHTTLDTCGYLGDRLSDADLDAVDLVLLDIKSWDVDTHRHVTGREVGPVLQFARRLADLGKPTWLRFVLVPDLTDDHANVEGLAAFAATLPNVERVEVLPFHQMGREKWQRLDRHYALHDTEPPEPALVERVVDQFRAHGLRAA